MFMLRVRLYRTQVHGEKYIYLNKNKVEEKKKKKKIRLLDHETCVSHLLTRTEVRYDVKYCFISAISHRRKNSLVSFSEPDWWAQDPLCADVRTAGVGGGLSS